MNGELLSLILPTYNEVENIGPLIQGLKEVLKGTNCPFEIIVVDDQSPDGTALKVKELSSADGRIKLFIREEERGLAKSIKYGLEKARGELILIMDTDFNHNPVYIPRMLDGLTGYDLIIGSRYVRGGGMPFSKIRYLTSLLANIFLKTVLALPFHDSLSGFLLLRKEVLKGMDRGKIFQGYGDYAIRFLYWADRKGFKAREIPVIYEERAGGKSKTKFFKISWQYLLTVLNIINP